MAKEEFSRSDPEKSHKSFWLVIFNWIFPSVSILIGIFLTTQKFAFFMNYDSRVVGNPLFLIGKLKVYNPLIFILGMFKYLFNDVYSFYFFKAIPPTIISIVIAIITFIVTRMLITAHQKNQHIHGTADWAKLKHLKKVGYLQKKGIVCCQLDSADVSCHINAKNNLALNLPNHLFYKPPFKLVRGPKIADLVCHPGTTNTWVIAPTRSGKGVNTIIPTLLNYGVPYYQIEKDENTHEKVKKIKGKGSIVCFDPKGENWEATAGYRSKFSVCIPFRPLDENENTAHYNPIHEIPNNPLTAFAWADIIGEIFFGADNAKTSSDGAAQYFNNTARDIFDAVVLHVRFSKEIDWKDKNLGTVLDFFSQAKDSKDNDEAGEDAGPGAKMLAKMREDNIHVLDNGEVNQQIHDLIVKAANRSETQNAKERASTYSTIFSKISLFQDDLLRKATAYSDFSVDDFIKGINPISLYLIVPYNHIKRISPIFRMIITFMIKKFSDGTTNANEVKLKIPCLFLLDEFPVLGYFPDIALNAGILAGYGVTFLIVSQSLNQIVDVYGENHPFLDHCKTIILYAPGNLKDARMFSETIGNRSVLLDNISSSGATFDVGFSNVSRSSQEVSTSLISPDELMKLHFTKVIVFIQGVPPYKGKKVVYYEDPRFKNKAFKKVPEMKDIIRLMKTFPSNKRTKYIRPDSLTVAIKEIESFEAEKIIPSKFDLFGD